MSARCIVYGLHEQLNTVAWYIWSGGDVGSIGAAAGPGQGAPQVAARSHRWDPPSSHSDTLHTYIYSLSRKAFNPAECIPVHSLNLDIRTKMLHISNIERG